MKNSLLLSLIIILPITARAIAAKPSSATLDYTIDLTVASEGWDGKKCWVHSRAGAIPPRVPGNPTDLPIVVMTTQKHLVTGNDIFDGLLDFRTDDLGRTWKGPRRHNTLRRRTMGENLQAAPCDFTPQWHAKTGKLLGTGKTFWYKNNKHFPGPPSDTIYSVYDPTAEDWSTWEKLKYPDLRMFKNASAGCTQRYDLPNGDVLLPIYFQPNFPIYDHQVTVVRCRFDGKTLSYISHGDELAIPKTDSDEGGNGFSEPSLTKFGDRFFLTIRSSNRGYVTTSSDGQHFAPLRQWRFDDGTELGSYRTQQHWVTHSEGLFLVYTRRGLNNDHVFRHRAPLVIARVDPEKQVVLRETERILVPEKGTRIGNFGVVNVSPEETWVITTEWMQGPPPGGFEKYGSNNRIYAAKLRWNHPNQLVR